MGTPIYSMRMPPHSINLIDIEDIFIELIDKGHTIAFQLHDKNIVILPHFENVIPATQRLNWYENLSIHIKNSNKEIDQETFNTISHRLQIIGMSISKIENIHGLTTIKCAIFS